MKKLLLALPLLIASPASFAFSLSLAPNPADQSVQFLGSIFGHVGNLLQGNASPMIGQLFRMFNYAVILLAVILITYTIFVSIVNTANDGEVMGKKWSSIWVPFRTVMGIMLLLPIKSGYSLMQFFVIWVVLQGVGAADSLWNMAVDAMAHGGAVSAPSFVSSNNSALQAIYQASGNLLKAQVCVDTVQQIYGQNANFSCKVVPDGNDPFQEYQIACDGSIADQNGNTVSYPLGVRFAHSENYSSLNNQYPNGTISSQPIYMAIQTAFQQMLLDIQPAALAITTDTYNALSNAEGTSTNNNFPVDNPNFHDQNVPGNAVSNAANAYQSIVGAATASYITQATAIAANNAGLSQCSG